MFAPTATAVGIYLDGVLIVEQVSERVRSPESACSRARRSTLRSCRCSPDVLQKGRL